MFFPTRSSRRAFVRNAGYAVAGFQVKMPMAAAQQQLAINASTLAPFVDPLPLPPVAKPCDRRPHPLKPGETVPYYRIALREQRVKVHRDLSPTRHVVFRR